MQVSSFQIFLILSVDHIATYLTKKLMILRIPTILSTIAQYDPSSAFFIQESKSASLLFLSEKSPKKEGKQASHHKIPLMSRKCQPNSCHNKRTSKSQQKKLTIVLSNTVSLMKNLMRSKTNLRRRRKK